MFLIRSPLLATLTVLLATGMASADVIFDWIPDSAHIKQRSLSAITGANGILSGDPDLDLDTDGP